MPKSRRWLEAALLILIPALAYLPNVFDFTFHRDDWFYIYDGITLGPRAFPALFEHLRPMRGPFFAALFALFGPNPLPYHLLLFVWRVVGGFGMFWLLRLLWPAPSHRTGAFWASTLFTIYPGFLWWVGGFEYQPMVLSAVLHVFSIAFMLKGILAEKLPAKILWTLAAILSSLVVLGFVDYAIGMELFRVLCAYVILSREDSGLDTTDKRRLPFDKLRASLDPRFIATFKRLLLSIRVSLPALLGPILFLVWRQFFFENWRKAADAGLQLSRLLDEPQTILIWFYRLLEGTAKVIFMAWTVPLHDRLNFDSLEALVIALALAAILAALVFLAERFFARESEVEQSDGWNREALWIGLLGVLGGMVPIVAANRYVSFEQFSHYALPASMAAAVFLFGAWSGVQGRTPRAVAVAALVVCAGITHYIQSVNVAREARILSQFWHQVAWRAPTIRPGATLVVDFAGISYAESADLVWGPANIIYYPHASDTAPIRVPISAARREGDLIKNAVIGEVRTQNYIVINVFRYDYSNLLVISQPSGASCVHVMDNRWPAFAPYEDETIRALAEYSKIENIQQAESHPVLPANLFGEEPPREWCFYYERADLARQLGDWAEAARLGAEAGQKGYAASDPIEWIPFLQAYVLLGDADALGRLVEELKSNAIYKADRDYYKVQFCNSVGRIGNPTYAADEETLRLAESLFCR